MHSQQGKQSLTLHDEGTQKKLSQVLGRPVLRMENTVSPDRSLYVVNVLRVLTHPEDCLLPRKKPTVRLMSVGFFIGNGAKTVGEKHLILTLEDQ